MLKVKRLRRMKPIYKKIFERAKPFLRTRRNLVHTRIAVQYAIGLLREGKGDEEVVVPAILLHDVGWKALPEPLQLTAFGPNPSNPKLVRVHEREGAKIARSILEEVNYSPGKVKEICRIVQGHDSRRRPISLNDRIVKDADKLFRYSRKGLAIDLDRFRVPRKKYLFFLEKRIDQWFLSPTGKEIAKKEILLRKRHPANRKKPVRLSK